MGSHASNVSHHPLAIVLLSIKFQNLVGESSLLSFTPVSKYIKSTLFNLLLNRLFNNHVVEI